MRLHVPRRFGLRQLALLLLILAIATLGLHHVNPDLARVQHSFFNWVLMTSVVLSYACLTFAVAFCINEIWERIMGHR